MNLYSMDLYSLWLLWQVKMYQKAGFVPEELLVAVVVLLIAAAGSRKRRQ